MKKAFSILLAIVVIVYARQAYLTYVSDRFVQNQFTGALSDIAEEVVAIPLYTEDSTQRIETARSIRQEGNNLFLISNATLYRFTREGKFVCQITKPDEIEVAGYVINHGNRELIVLGNEDDIFYYDYEGGLLERKKLKSDLAGFRMQSFSMLNDKIWAIEESMTVDADTQEISMQQQVVVYDSSFQKLQSHVLKPVDLGREGRIANRQSPQLMIDEDTLLPFVFAPSQEVNYLLDDTLFLHRSLKQQLQYIQTTNQLALVPVIPGRRFWVSSFHRSENTAVNYSFCYDSLHNASITLPKGWEDNFYHTGMITDMEPMDHQCHTFSFCKSGEAVKGVFSKANEEADAVVFIVKLKEA